MSKKPTVKELGADIVALLDSIGNINSLPTDIKRSTLVEVILVLKALIEGWTTGGGQVLSSLSQLLNDVGFITANDIPAPPTVPTKISDLENDSNFATITGARTSNSQLNAEVRTDDPIFDASQVGRIWYRSDLDV